MPNEIRVHGFRELSRAFAKAGKNLKKELTKSLKDVAEPVRADAAHRAGLIHNIRMNPEGPDWSEMRTGVHTAVVFVAPKQRRKVGPPRPKFGTLLMESSMLPALEAHSSDVEHELGLMLDKIGSEWGRGG